MPLNLTNQPTNQPTHLIMSLDLAQEKYVGFEIFFSTRIKLCGSEMVKKYCFKGILSESFLFHR